MRETAGFGPSGRRPSGPLPPPGPGARGARRFMRRCARRYRRGFSLFGVLLGPGLAAVVIVGAVGTYNAARESAKPLGRADSPEPAPGQRRGGLRGRAELRQRRRPGAGHRPARRHSRRRPGGGGHQRHDPPSLRRRGHRHRRAGGRDEPLPHHLRGRGRRHLRRPGRRLRRAQPGPRGPGGDGGERHRARLARHQRAGDRQLRRRRRRQRHRVHLRMDGLGPKSLGAGTRAAGKAGAQAPHAEAEARHVPAPAAPVAEVQALPWRESPLAGPPLPGRRRAAGRAAAGLARGRDARRALRGAGGRTGPGARPGRRPRVRRLGAGGTPRDAGTRYGLRDRARDATRHPAHRGPAARARGRPAGPAGAAGARYGDDARRDLGWDGKGRPPWRSAFWNHDPGRRRCVQALWMRASRRWRRAAAR